MESIVEVMVITFAPGANVKLYLPSDAVTTDEPFLTTITALESSGVTVKEAVSLSPVAPLAGAWIETLTYRSKIPECKVAPLAGAWIETGF